MGAQSKTVVVDVSPDHFYKVITDFEKYHEFLGSVRKTEIVNQAGNVAEVFFEIDLIKTIKYTLRMEAHPPDGLRWTLIEGDLFKVNSGSWQLKPADDGKATEATYTTDVDFNLFVPKMITNKLASVSLPTTLSEFKTRAESLYA